MIPELGHFALILCLGVALIQGALPLMGASTGRESWMRVGRSSARVQFFLVLLAFLALVYGFTHDDFSVRYIAATSSRLLPMQYKVAAVWGGHEGSILLWLLMLSFWMGLVSVFNRHLPLPVEARVLSVMSWISVGFLLFILLTSNPFERLLPAALEGRDLNPLLQDPGMVIHPPMLYMGYVGFSVCFAFALAALIGGQLDSVWARWSRPWTTVAWVFLTLGICLGSAWAYYTLGWGGWWFWDPVENASFMPWLVGTALLHSLAVTEKRGGFRVWTVLLAILAFSLSLLGTFLVRSGVLTSVHAFASDPQRGVFILMFLVLVIGSSLLLFAWRAPKVGLGTGFSWFSKESLLLGNNVLFASAAGSVLLGTLYPLFLDALGLGKISVGPPYFDTVFVPLMAPALLLMGVAPLTGWQQGRFEDLKERYRWVILITISVALGLSFTLPQFSWASTLGFVLTLWILLSVLLAMYQRLRTQRVSSIPAGFWGMVVAHLGVAVFIVGVTMVKSAEIEKDVDMGLGDTVTLGPYVFEFKGVETVPGPNYRATRAEILVSKRGVPQEALHPEKRIYQIQSMPMTNAAIDTGIFRDLYVSLGEPIGASRWVVRVYYKPFVDWIWGGSVLMALGGLITLWDRRYRLQSRPT